MASGITSIPNNVVERTGPLLLGYLFNWGLFGVLSVQVYIYYLGFPRDRPLPKILVTVTYLTECIQISLSTRDAFHDFGSGWGNTSELDDVGWQWFSVVILMVVLAPMSQLFYAWRIWNFSGKKWVPILIVMLSLLHTSAGLYDGILIAIVARYSILQERTYKSTTVWLVGTSTCDIVIAISMTYYLRRTKPGFRDTITLLTRIVHASVGTGIFCAIIAILDLSMFLSFPHNNFHVPFCTCLSKLYSNSLLVVLNARIQIVGGRNDLGALDNVSLPIVFNNEVVSQGESIQVTMIQSPIQLSSRLRHSDLEIEKSPGGPDSESTLEVINTS